jgi:hypothetical protein
VSIFIGNDLYLYDEERLGTKYEKTPPNRLGVSDAYTHTHSAYPLFLVWGRRGRNLEVQTRAQYLV